MKQLLSIVSILVFLAGIASAQTVTSISPFLDSDDVSATSNITINFSEAMNNATITSSTVIISGSQRGTYSGSFSYGSNSATFDPDSSFFSGEIITVIVTTGVEDLGNDPITAPYRTMFTVAASGDGEFTVGNEYTADGSNFTDWTITADINEDGYLDIISLVPSQNKMVIFTNDGDGTFSGPTNITTANSFQVEAKDVNQDGAMDLVTSNNNAFMMSVFINNGGGSGTFASKVDYANGSSWNGKGLATGDIDNDGDEDVLIDVIIGGSVDSVQIFTNDGDGTFTLGAGISTTDQFEQIKLVDIDGDEDLDFVGLSPGLGQLVTYDNNGSGSFSINTVHTATNSSYQFILANFKSSSSKIEAMIVDQADDEIRYLGDGSPNAFGALPSTIMVGDTPVAIASGDLDGDGHIDVVVSNANDTNLSIIMNDGTPSFTESNYSTGSTYANYISLADVDNDGDLDIVMGNQDGTINVAFNFSGPEVVSITPANSTTDVASNSDITIKFNEAMKSSTLNSTNVTVVGNTAGTIAATYTYNSGDSTLTIDPSSNFILGDEITVTATTNVTSDADVAITSSAVSTFDIEDVKVQSATPAHNSYAVAANTDIDITFNDNMDVATLTTSNIQVFGSLSGNAAGSISTTSNSASFNPTSDFLPDETIFVIVTTGVENSSNVPLSDPYTLQFKVSGITEFLTEDDTVKTTGTAPYEVEIADLNVDGHLDLIFPNGNDNEVGILLNNGSGLYTTSYTALATGTLPTSVTTGDFDNQNGMDFVVTNFTDGDIRVYLNDGSGSFSTADYAANTGTIDAVVADFDGDGYLDIIAHNRNSANASIFINDQDGTFTSSGTISVTTNQDRIFAADIDNDNDIDIAVGGAGTVLFTAKNNGDGTFASAVNTSIATSGVEFVDLDGDNFLDLVVANSSSDQVSVHINDDSGSFGTGTNYSVLGALDVSAFDYGNDGDMDLAVINNEDSEVQILLNGGSGTFSNGQSLSLQATPEQLAIADLDKDGQLDFVTANRGNNRLSIHYGVEQLDITSISPTNNALNISTSSNLTATFTKSVDGATLVDTSVVVVGSKSGKMTGVISYDDPSKTVTFNPDSAFISGERISMSLTDKIATSNGTELNPYASSFTVAVSGTGNMAYQDSLVLSNSVFRMLGTDIDGDGDEDLIGFSNSIIDVYEQDAGAFSFLAQSTMPSGFERAYPTDIDQDGDIDLAVHPFIGTNQIRFLENNGSGSFTITDTLVVSSAPKELVFEDFDGDGIIDLAYVYGAQITIINWGQGDFEFSGTATFGGGPGYPTPSIITSGDVDNDGDIDIIVSGEDKVVIGINGGDRTFDYENIYDVATDPEDIELGDFDGDGYLDIVVTSEEGAAYSILINDQDGTFTEAVEYSTSPYWAYDVTVFDYDGDGDLDLGIYLEDNDSGDSQMLFAYNQSGSFSNQLGYELPSASPYFYDGAGSSYSFVDIDGDNDLDLASLVRNSGGNQVFAFSSNEAGSSVAPTVAASSVSFSSIAAYSAKVSWTNGDGARRMVLVKEGSAVDGTPVDDSGYNPNSVFTSGDEIGTGNYLVYGGASNSVVLSGLDPETEYHVQVFELNGIPGSEKFFTTGAPTGSFTSGPPPTIWSKNDSTLVFTKADNADWALEANQDRITDNLWLTRKDNRGLFNILDEFEFDSDVSPEGTMWALGTTDNLANLSFDTFYNTLGESIGDNIENADMVLYVEADDLYLDINFSSWTSGGEGGGFSYTRAKGPAPLVMTQTFQDSAGFALRFDNDNSYERYLEVYDDSNLLGSEFTMEAWVKLDSLGIEQGIMSLDSEVGFGITSTNTVYAYHNQPEAVSSGGGEGPPCCEGFSASTSNLKSALTPVLTEFAGPSGTVSLESSDVLAKDEWYHIALTGESGGFLKLYINGVIQDSDSVQNVGVDESYWYFGRERDRFVYLYGFMDEVRIWKDERTASQIRSYMHRPYGGDIARLYGYWQFNEGTGTSTFDGLSNREAEFNSGNSSAWFTSDAPIGNGTVEETSDFQTGTTNIGNAALSMADGFDNPVDVQVTEVSGNPNQFPTGFTSGLGGKYFVINLFGDPGTFSASLTLTYGAGVITAAQQSNPSQLKLYKRGSNSTGTWTEIASASSANSTTGVVTWNGITAFSQFMAVNDEPTFNIQIVDGTDIISYNDSTFTFADSLFDLEDGFNDSLLTINSKSTLTGTLYLDQNSNGVYDGGTDSLLTADKELQYTPSGSIKLRYRSSSSGLETAVIKLQHEVGVDSVSLDFFTVEGDPSIAGNADENGWYLLSNPFTTTIGELLSNVWTQGAVNSDAPAGDASLFTFSEDSSKYVAITTDLDTTKLAAGQGILVYLFEDDDLGDGQDDIDGGWPKSLINYGNPFGTDVTITAKNVNHDGVSGTSGSEGFVLMGNPYGWSLSADSVISTLKREDPLANSYVYRWNAVEKTYQILSSGSINPYESVFIRTITSGATANLSFDYDDAEGVLSKEQQPSMFELNLVHSESERSSKFHLRNGKDAKEGIDPYDGYYLGTYARSYSNLYSIVEDQPLSISNIPLGFNGEIEIPLYADATLSGDFAISWDLETIPEEWTITLENNATGEMIAMNELNSYSFSLVNKGKSVSDFSNKLFSIDNVVKKDKSDNQPVLIMKVTSSLSVGTDEELGIPNQVELYQNYPNPFNPSSIIRFGVPTQSKVRLEVFDILGRRVATLLNNEIKPAGRYNISFVGNNLASGMYLYRLSVGSKVIVKKMTLIK